jgi:hypothetical protein
MHKKTKIAFGVAAFYFLMPVSPARRAFELIRLGSTSAEVDRFLEQLPVEDREEFVMDGSYCFDWEGPTKRLSFTGGRRKSWPISRRKSRFFLIRHTNTCVNSTTGFANITTQIRATLSQLTETVFTTGGTFLCLRLTGMNA